MKTQWTENLARVCAVIDSQWKTIDGIRKQAKLRRDTTKSIIYRHLLSNNLLETDTKLSALAQNGTEVAIFRARVDLVEWANNLRVVKTRSVPGETAPAELLAMMSVSTTGRTQWGVRYR